MSAPRTPVRVQVIPWDADTDQVVVLHDGVQVWTDTMGHFDQYLKFVAPLGVPIILEIIED